MVGLWILLALLGLVGLVMLLPVVVWFRHHQDGLKGHLAYKVQIGPVNLSGTKDLDQLAKKGAKTKAKVEKVEEKRPVPSPAKLFEVAMPAVRYFCRQVRFKRLDLVLEVGGLDAFESAMLAGVGWTVAGIFGSILSHIFVLPPGIYRASVLPNWQNPAFGANLDCMLTFRVGHAIKAGVLLLKRAQKSGILAELLGRRRQKGVR